MPEDRQTDVWIAITSQIAELYGNGDDQVIIVEGGCPTGADRYARDYVVHMKQYNAPLPVEVHLETHLADWNRHGRLAGPIRNKQMVDAGADVCIAFYQKGAGNRGTSNCVEAAEKAGIPVVIPKGFEK